MQVLNMPEKTCHLGFSFSESTLLPTPTTLKPLTGKAQWQPDHAQHSCTVRPWGFTESSVPELSVFPSGLQTELRRSGACSPGRTHAGVWRPVCIGSLAILTTAQHMSRWGAEQCMYVCLEVSSWNTGCLATKSCLSPTLILGLWIRHFWSPDFPYPLSPNFPVIQVFQRSV